MLSLLFANHRPRPPYASLTLPVLNLSSTLFLCLSLAILAFSFLFFFIFNLFIEAQEA